MDKTSKKKKNLRRQKNHKKNQIFMKFIYVNKIKEI